MYRSGHGLALQGVLLPTGARTPDQVNIHLLCLPTHMLTQTPDLCGIQSR